jgi:hypothetical protein
VHQDLPIQPLSSNSVLACRPKAEKDWSGLTLVQFRIWKSGESHTTSVEQISQACALRTPFAALI